MLVAIELLVDTEEVPERFCRKAEKSPGCGWEGWPKTLPPVFAAPPLLKGPEVCCGWPNTEPVVFCGLANTDPVVFWVVPNAEGVVVVFPPPNALGAAGVPNAEGCPKTEPPLVPPALVIADANEVGCELAKAEKPPPPPVPPEPEVDAGVVVEAPAPNGLGPALANAPNPVGCLIKEDPPAAPVDVCPNAGCPNADVVVVVLAGVVDVCPNAL